MPATAVIPIATALSAIAPTASARSIELFKHGTLQVKFYAPRGLDPQTPHAQDELYVIASGSGLFWDGDKRTPIQPGDLIFAAAGQPHRFEDFSDDFGTWVMFYGPYGGEVGAT
jgi:mannose-6-phosphate isomerase-like protein (cupin superfamily)